MLAWNFLELVNDLNKRLNEVPLNSDNFGGASGFYGTAKDAVNAALNEVYRDAFQWPFTYTSVTTPLVVDQSTYTYPSNVKSASFDTFRIKGDSSKNVMTIRLRLIDYEEYLNNHGDADFNPSRYSSVPRLICRRPNKSFTIFPPPNDDYEIVYDAYTIPSDLVMWDDVPVLPEEFRHILTDGSVGYGYLFRGDPEGAGSILQKFKEGVKDFRKLYQNRYEYARGGMINQNRGGL